MGCGRGGKEEITNKVIGVGVRRGAVGGGVGVWAGGGGRDIWEEGTEKKSSVDKIRSCRTLVFLGDFTCYVPRDRLDRGTSQVMFREVTLI